MLMRLATTTAIRRAKEVAELAYHEAGADGDLPTPVRAKNPDIHAAPTSAAPDGPYEIADSTFWVRPDGPLSDPSSSRQREGYVEEGDSLHRFAGGGGYESRRHRSWQHGHGGRP